MKNRFLLLALAAITLFGMNARAQTTITTVGTGYTGTNAAGANYAITFVIENLSGNDILLTGVGNFWNAGDNGQADLWYSSTSLSGTYGTLGTPTWNLIASNNVNCTVTGITPAFSGLTFLIPNGAQYRFALNSAAYCRYSGTGAGTCTPNTFTASGVTLKVGDIQIAGSYIGYAATNNPRFFTGYITFANACALPTNLAATNVTVNSADLSWTPPSGSAGSEYILDQNPASPSGAGTPTGGTTYHASGLSLNTTYYFHLRNKCNATAYSAYINYPFTTPNAYCLQPTNILFSNITTNSVDILWSKMQTSDYYQYKLDLTPVVPNGTNYLTTTGISTHVNGLLPDTKYYVQVRSICLNGGDSSTWKLDSFITKSFCGAPDVHVNNPGSNEPQVWWNAIKSAVSYEYKLTDNTMDPAFGTPTTDTVLTLTLPTDNSDQYLHIRTKCNSQFLFSPWAATALRTTPQSINSVAGLNNIIAVYPNPVKDMLTVELKAWQNNTNATISLTDIAGRVLKTVPVISTKTTLNTQGVTPGIYLIRYADDMHNEVIRINKQ